MDKKLLSIAKDLDLFFALDHQTRLDDLDLRNRVACQLLAPVQHLLPQCAVFDATGHLKLMRQPILSITGNVIPLPQHLLLINWADTAPGVSWPEDYYVTFAPSADRFIVTASMDCTDVWGVTDLAIGSFSGGIPVKEGSGEILRDWWSLYGDLGPWAYVWREGLIDWDTAYHLRDAATEGEICTDLS